METIIRTKDGFVDIDRTVHNTVKVLAHKTGYIRIETIQNSINAQLKTYERIPRKRIVRSLATLLERGQNA